MDKSLVEGEAPTIVSSSVRTREYLTATEVERLRAAARKFSRWGHRDATMILLGYRHGLRALELVSGRACHGPSACAPGKERHAERASAAGRGTARSAPSAA